MDRLNSMACASILETFRRWNEQIRTTPLRDLCGGLVYCVLGGVGMSQRYIIEVNTDFWKELTEGELISWIGNGKMREKF